LLVNTTDLVGDRIVSSRNRYRLIHTAYPVRGYATIHCGGVGSIAAGRGINEQGLAIGASSGGSGRHASNFDGLEPQLNSRYALQFTKMPMM